MPVYNRLAKLRSFAEINFIMLNNAKTTNNIFKDYFRRTIISINNMPFHYWTIESDCFESLYI